MMNHLFAISLMAAAGLCASSFGCGEEEPADEQTTDDAIASSQGQLAIRLAGEDDVAGFTIEVFNGTTNVKKYVSVEEEGLDPRLVDAGLGGMNDQHRFSDALFVLSPGEYNVWATPSPRADAGPHCARAVGKGIVKEGSTTEIVLVSNCRRKDNGALDIVTLLNHAPEIVGLDISGSKWLRTCERAQVKVTAVDSDRDNLTITWSVLSKPAGALFDAIPEAPNGFRFTARTPGNYEVKVTACDTSNLCTSLTFPLHVSGPLSKCLPWHKAADEGVQ